MKRKKKGGRHAALTETEQELLAAAKERETEKERLCASFHYLRMAPSSLAQSAEAGRELYTYSDSLAFADVSARSKKERWKKPEGWSLIVLTVLLTAWLLFSFIYRLVTEADKLSAFLSLLPSFLVIAVADAIMLISAFGEWGTFLRFVFRHGLARGRDALSRRNLQNLSDDYCRVAENMRYENSLSVCERTVIFSLFGEKYTFAREAVSLRVRLVGGALQLAFAVDGLTLDFPFPFPKSEYVPLKKAFRERMKTERGIAQTEQEHDREGRRLYGGSTLGSVVVGAVMATVVLAIAVLLIVAHYLWLPQLPPFVGIFFVGAAALAYCNTFHYIPVVDEVGLPLIFSLILCAIPLWILIWIETELYHRAFTLVYFLTHCTPYAAGFTFLFCMGVYALVFSVQKAFDYARFGSTKE